MTAAASEPSALAILLVEDNPGDADLICDMLEESGPAGIHIEHVIRLAEAFSRIAEKRFDIALLDLGLPDSAGLDTLKTFCGKAPDLPVAVLTGLDDERAGIEAVAAGAQDFLVKGQITGALLKRVIRYGIERNRAQRQLQVREREVTTLLESASAVLDCSSFEEAARRVFDACRTALGADSGYVALLSKDGKENEVVFFESGGRPCGVDESLPMPIRGLRAEAYRLGEAVYENSFASSQWMDFMPAGHVDLDNVLFAPLLLNGEMAGLLGLANKPGGFNDDDARLAAAFGQQAAIALRNARDREALRASEEFLNGAGAMARVGGWEINLETDTVYWTRATRLIHEVPEDYIPSLEEALQFYPGEDRRRISEAVQRAREYGEAYDLELQFITAKGRLLWVQAAGKPEMHAGKCVRLHGTFQDITERKQAEARIKRLSRFPSEDPNPVMRILDSGILEYANGPAAPLVEAMSASPGKTVSPKWQKRVEKVLGQGVPLNLEERMGDRVYGLTMAPVAEHGYVNVYAMDITERIHAREALRTSEAKLRSIVDNVGVGISMVDRDMRILDLNHRMQDWFPEADSAKRPYCYNVLGCSQGDKPCEDCPGLLTYRNGKVHESIRQLSVGTDTRNFRITSSPIFNERGDTIAVIKMFEDVTERVHLEEQLRQSQKMEAIGQLAGGVAHDFNNILQAMMGYSSMLRAVLPKEEETYEFASEIEQGTERAAALTRQLLMFSRRQVMQPSNMVLNDVVDNLLKMLRRVIGENIRLEWLPGKRLGTVYADPGMIEQVLMNLCINARDAMPDGGVLTIETQNVLIDSAYCDNHVWASPGRYVLLSVTDTGCGVAPEIMERIFEPFFTTKEQGKGTGLGLATVYGIIRQHEGMVNVYSEVGKGSTFKVYLPLSEQPASSVGAMVQGRAEGGNETILLAEDEANVRLLAVRLLEKAGYTVIPAEDGAEAVRLFKEHAENVDILFLDVVMPNLSGHQAMEEIHKIKPELPVLFSSGYSENAVHTNFVLHEGLKLIQKPYAPDVLLRSIREVLDGEDEQG